MKQVSRTRPSRSKALWPRGICVVGCGRWGSSLLASLEEHSIASYAIAGRVAPQALHAIESPAWVKADVFWLCVPDTEIQRAAKRLVATLRHFHASLESRVVLHSSGVYSSAILSDAADAGAGTGSIHPLMTFPTRTPISLEGVPFAVEAPGRLRASLVRLVEGVGGKPFQISSKKKALYHAAAVMASPLLVSLASAAVQAAHASGLTRAQANKLLQPIMQATLDNFFRAGGIKSFSGPFARGDAATVSLHLQALAAHPLLEHVYRSLGLHALDALPAENKQMLQRNLRAR